MLLVTLAFVGVPAPYRPHSKDAKTILHDEGIKATSLYNDHQIRTTNQTRKTALADDELLENGKANMTTAVSFIEITAPRGGALTPIEDGLHLERREIKCLKKLPAGKTCRDLTYGAAGRNCHAFFYYHEAKDSWKPCRNPHGIFWKNDGDPCKALGVKTMTCHDEDIDRAHDRATKLAPFASEMWPPSGSKGAVLEDYEISLLDKQRPPFCPRMELGAQPNMFDGSSEDRRRKTAKANKRGKILFPEKLSYVETTENGPLKRGKFACPDFLEVTARAWLEEQGAKAISDVLEYPKGGVTPWIRQSGHFILDLTTGCYKNGATEEECEEVSTYDGLLGSILASGMSTCAGIFYAFRSKERPGELLYLYGHHAMSSQPKHTPEQVLEMIDASVRVPAAELDVQVVFMVGSESGDLAQHVQAYAMNTEADPPRGNSVTLQQIQDNMQNVFEMSEEDALKSMHLDLSSRVGEIRVEFAAYYDKAPSKSVPSRPHTSSVRWANMGLRPRRLL
jgi:hypothetical protein